MVDDLVAAGSTVLLTTQCLEEAVRLAHRLNVVDQGRVIVGLTAANAEVPRPRRSRSCSP